jgi:hypothetical protein
MPSTLKHASGFPMPAQLNTFYKSPQHNYLRSFPSTYEYTPKWYLPMKISNPELGMHFLFPPFTYGPYIHDLLFNRSNNIRTILGTNINDDASRYEISYTNICYFVSPTPKYYCQHSIFSCPQSLITVLPSY